MILAYIRHTYNLILISCCTDKSSWPTFWNILPLVDVLEFVPYCSLILELSAVLDSCNLFPRPFRRSGIAYDSLSPIDLASHFTASGPMRVVRPLCSLLAHVSSGNFRLGASLRNFRFGSYFCLLARFAAFGLLALDGPPCGLRPTIT